MPSSSLPTDDTADAIAREFQEYTYTVSHDLSAPVRAMVEFSKLLTKEHGASLSEEGQQYLSIVIESGQKLQNMMHGLLAYSRLNTVAKPHQPVDCNKLLRHCAASLQGTIDATHATIDITHMPTVQGSIDQVAQLFTVLLENSLKFISPERPPHIHITAKQQDSMWQFSISDNGIGIAPQFHQHIFKIFQRLHADEEYPGIGMGLTLAKKIAQQHGGDIWCEPNTDHGTTFLFTLPQEQ